MWQAKPPPHYIALGVLATRQNRVPDKSDMRCVHKSLVTMAEAQDRGLAKLRGTSARDQDKDVYLFPTDAMLNTFAVTTAPAVPPRVAQIDFYGAAPTAPGAAAKQLTLLKP